MITRNSRYVGAEIYSVRFNSDEKLRRTAIYPPEAYPIGFQFTRYVTKYGDRVDMLAERYYGDPSVWWFIASANPEISYPGRLEPGTVLRIPNERANA